MKTIFTIAGLPHEYPTNTYKPNLSPLRKKYQRLLLCQQLPPNAVPLHATILQNKKLSILITGASKSGKTSLARSLVKDGYNILANDFVVVWQKNGQVMAGDLNLKKINKRKTSTPISHIFCLSTQDSRDLFKFTPKEFTRFYSQSLPEISSRFISKFTKTDIFTDIFSHHIVLGNRQTQTRWHKNLTSQLKLIKQNNIGIIGMGTIGQSLSNLLLTQPWINQLNLYSPNQNKLQSIKMDLDSANPPFPIIQHKQNNSLIKQSNLIILCFKSNKKHYRTSNNERFRRLIPNVEEIWKLSRRFRRQPLSKKVLVVTNPVDLLSWALYHLSNRNNNFKLDWQGLSSHQILGIGLGLDYSRLKTIIRKPLELIGEHGKNIYLCKKESDILHPINRMNTLNKVKNYSPKIRQHLPRTVFGPVHEILNLIKALNSTKKHTIRVSRLEKSGTFFTGNIFTIHKSLLTPSHYLSQTLYSKLKKLRTIYKKHQVKILSHLKSVSTKKPS